MKKSYSFDQFFLSGLEESISPFLTESSKKWCKNLGFKSSIFSLLLLFLAFFLSKIDKNLSLISLSIIYFLMGIPAILNSIETIKKFQIDIFVLMTIAAFLALAIKKPYEGALLLILFGLSNALESTLAYKTKSAIHNLNKISPTKAFVIKEDGSMHEKSIKEINLGDNIFIKAGEIIPLDGIVIDGESSLNLEHITGESTPILTKKSDMVFAGSINIDGVLTISVKKTSHQSTINRIIELISRAQKSKPKIERLFDTFGKKYATTIIFAAIFFTLFLPLFFKISLFGVNGSIYRSLCFLIAASPCALIIATPASYLSAMSALAKNGILFKGGSIIDAINSCQMIALDKTGTLTRGELQFIEIEKISDKDGIDKKMAMDIICNLEKGSSHPIAKALRLKKFNKIDLKEFRSIPGYGVEAKVYVKGKYIQAFVGLSEHIEKKLSKDELDALEKKKREIEKRGEISSVLLISKDLFVLRFSDTIRTGAKKTISFFKKRGINPLMLTGDNEKIARAISKELNIKDIYFDLRPEDKVNLIDSLCHNSHLAMVGDGINDAPALAKATVGISLGKIGSATAIDASDVILLNDNISSLCFLFEKAKKTKEVLIQNIFFALSVIAVAGTSALLGLIPLYMAVILHEGGTVLVGFNSLRLLKGRVYKEK